MGIIVCTEPELLWKAVEGSLKIVVLELPEGMGVLAAGDLRLVGGGPSVRVVGCELSLDSIVAAALELPGMAVDPSTSGVP